MFLEKQATVQTFSLMLKMHSGPNTTQLQQMMHNTHSFEGVTKLCLCKTAAAWLKQELWDSAAFRVNRGLE